MTQETKLGLFVLIGLISLVISVVLLGDFQFQKRWHLNILFNDIAGLPTKAKVKIAGVDVGAVKSISLAGDKAKVTVWLKDDIKIHTDAKASIVSTGIIGSKYLELTIGSPVRPLLNNGDTLVGVDPMSLDKVVENVMQRLDEVFSSVGAVDVKKIGRDLSSTMENLRDVSEALRVALAEQENKLVDIVDSLDTFSRNMADITTENKDDVAQTIDQIKLAATNLNSVLARIEKGEGTIGALLSDEEMGEDLKATFTDLRETTKEARRALKRINLIQTDWDYRLRYDFRASVYRHDVGLRVSPDPSKFYFVGVSNAGDPDIVTGDPEELNTINFLLGRRFKYGEFYAGVIRDKGGLGGRVKPLWKWEPLRRVEVTAEAYDFFRQEPVIRPKVNVGARADLTKWASVGAQMEDIYYDSSLNAYMNLQFRDDDIAYILGLVGLAR